MLDGFKPEPDTSVYGLSSDGRMREALNVAFKLE